MSTKLTSIMHIRVTEELAKRIKTESQRLGLRTNDVARFALARGIGTLDGKQEQVQGNERI